MKSFTENDLDEFISQVSKADGNFQELKKQEAEMAKGKKVHRRKTRQRYQQRWK